MTTTFFIGVLGSAILVLGAAWPERATSHPLQSVKNWLFFTGGLCMFAYSVLGYQEGGSLLFVLLQVMVNIASIFMMLNTRDRFDTPALLFLGACLAAYSLWISPHALTLLFVCGLTGISVGYAGTAGTLKREVSLACGSALIAAFSAASGSWVFFWLNVFFVVFSGMHALRLFSSVRKA